MCFFKRFSSEVCGIVAWPFLQKCEIRCRKLKFCEGREPDAWQTLGGGAEDRFRGTPENRICRYVDFLFIPFFRVLPRPPPPSVGPSQYQASRSASGFSFWAGTRCPLLRFLLPVQTCSPSSLPLLHPRTDGARVWSFSGIPGTSRPASHWLLTT